MRRLIHSVRRYLRNARGFLGGELVLEWRRDADVLERRGAGREADLMRDMASELERRIEAYKLAELTLEDAAKESGYSRRGLEKMIKRGNLANVGENGSPRVRRGDLPRKARSTADGETRIRIITGGVR